MGILKNARWEKFCQELVKGASAVDAYERAGYKRQKSEASVLHSRPEIQERIAELQGRAVEKAVLTKAWVIEKLIANVERAMQYEEVKDREGNGLGEFKYDGGVANRALELLGKEVGMFVDRKEVGKPGEFDSLDAEERQRVLDALDAELARREGKAATVGEQGSAKPISSLH